jgi:outer membrane protein TolC
MAPRCCAAVPTSARPNATWPGATARIGVATADLYPSISLGASVGSTGLLDHFGAGNAFRWSLGPLISWTLPDTGSARSRIAQAEAGTDGALARSTARCSTR